MPSIPYAVRPDAQPITIGPLPFDAKGITLVNSSSSVLIVTDDRGISFRANASTIVTAQPNPSKYLILQLDKPVANALESAVVYVSDVPLPITSSGLAIPVAGGGVKTTVSDIAGGPPLAPADTDIWIATNVGGVVGGVGSGLRWAFQYNGGSASAFKWEFIGGPDQLLDTVTNDAGIVNQWVKDARTQITIVRAGDYNVRYSGSFFSTGAGAWAIGVDLTTQAFPSEQLSSDLATPNFADIGIAERKMAGLAVNNVVTGFWLSNAGLAVTAQVRCLSITPIRIA